MLSRVPLSVSCLEVLAVLLFLCLHGSSNLVAFAQPTRTTSCYHRAAPGPECPTRHGYGRPYLPKAVEAIAIHSPFQEPVRLPHSITSETGSKTTFRKRVRRRGRNGYFEGIARRLSRQSVSSNGTTNTTTTKVER